MKDVIDVLAMQREKRNTLQKSITIDYTQASDSFAVSRFIFECGEINAKSRLRFCARSAFVKVLIIGLFLSFDRRTEIGSPSVDNSDSRDIVS